MHFIYYINRSRATKVDSTYLGYRPTAHSVYVVASGGRELVTFRSLSPTFSSYNTYDDSMFIFQETLRSCFNTTTSFRLNETESILSLTIYHEQLDGVGM